MKTTTITLLLALLAATFSNAQRIERVESFWGTRYTLPGERNSSMNRVISIMEPNSEAQLYMIKAKKGRLYANILSIGGGGFMGWSLGGLTDGGKMDWITFGIGATMTAVFIPVAIKSDKNLRKGIELHNATQPDPVQTTIQPKFNLLASGNGLGLSMQF